MSKKFAVYETKLGYYYIEEDCHKITCIKRVENPISMGEPTELTDLTYNQLIEYFQGDRKVFDIPYELNGTKFQKSVWKALCDIPYGETRTYKDIAIAIGNEKACRAVGMSNNKNPISIVVPCHRVIGANGKLVGYGDGLDAKEYLLKLEDKYK